MNNRIIICVFILIFFWGCTNPPPVCRYGTPKAVFSDTLPKIKTDDFSQKGQQATEHITFSNEVELTILQSGCDDIKQVFQFKLPENLTTQPADFFINQAINQLNYLGSLSDNHLSFGQIGQLVSEKKETIKLGKFIQLQENYYLKIDRILGENEKILLIEFSSTN